MNEIYNATHRNASIDTKTWDANYRRLERRDNGEKSRCLESRQIFRFKGKIKREKGIRREGRKGMTIGDRWKSDDSMKEEKFGSAIFHFRMGRVRETESLPISKFDRS